MGAVTEGYVVGLEAAVEVIKATNTPEEAIKVLEGWIEEKKV